MTPEELIRKRKRDELLKRANAAQTTAPSVEEKLVSDNTKETLKAAGHWAGVIGKRAAELTQKGAAAAAEKAREAKAQLDAKRARVAQEPHAAEEKIQGIPFTVEQEMLVRQLTSDAPAPVLAGAGDKGMFTLVELVEELGEPGAQVTDGMGVLPVPQDLMDSLSSNSLFFEAAKSLAESEGKRVPSPHIGGADELGARDARVTKTSWGVVVNTNGLPPQELIQSVKDAFYDGLASRATEADEVEEVDEALTVPNVFTETAETFSAVPEGSSQPPHAASVEQQATPSQSNPRTRWPWVLGSVVAVALVAGALYFLQEKNEQPQPSASAPVAPVAAPVVPEQVPEVVEAPVVAPAPAVLPEQAKLEPTIEKPEPVAAPVVTASAPKEAQPKLSPKRASPPSPKKAPAPAAVQKNDWQQKASDDLDAWAEKSGIK